MVDKSRCRGRVTLNPCFRGCAQCTDATSGAHIYLSTTATKSKKKAVDGNPIEGCAPSTVLLWRAARGLAPERIYNPPEGPACAGRVRFPRPPSFHSTRSSARCSELDANPVGKTDASPRRGSLEVFFLVRGQTDIKAHPSPFIGGFRRSATFPCHIVIVRTTNSPSSRFSLLAKSFVCVQ